MNSPIAWIDHNGTLLPTGGPILKATNRSFRYGDGLFETLLVQNGRIRLRNYHFARLFAGLEQLRFIIPSSFTRESLGAGILQLCSKNTHASLARVRLTVYRGDGALYDPGQLHYLIESSPLAPADIIPDTTGLTIGLYPDGLKSCDTLSNLKSNNFLLYALAALYAKEHRFDDCLVLNTHGRLADSTIANLFYLKDGQVYTPSLTEACVAGVMRRHLLSTLPTAGFSVHEQPVTAEDLLSADEVFLTNAVRGIRWVKTFRSSHYVGDLSRSVFNQLIKEAE